MSEFGQDLQSFKPSPSFTEVAANMEMMNQIIELNPSMLENFNFSVETFFSHHQQEFPENFSHSLNSDPVSPATNSPEDVFQENKKRKKMLGKGKEGRSKSEEVVHVRARRGQATDSHSLAERVRREKINDKMKCLQNLVPGCHKTMGMAGMLDEIINYIHSLQNQVEFLSMELAAASSYDSKLERVATEKLQEGINSQEAKETQQWAREPYGDHICFQCS